MKIMNTWTRKTKLAAAIMLAIAPLHAYAIWPVTDASLYLKVDALNQSVSSLLSQILSQLQQLTSQSATSATKIAETVSQATDNGIQRSVDMQNTNSQILAGRNTRMPIDPCANGARSIADPNFSRMQPGYSSGGGMAHPYGGSNAPALPSTGSSSLDKAIKISNGQMAAPSTETQALLAQKGVCDVYASGLRAQNCQAAGTPVGSVIYPNADIQADSLFVGAQTTPGMTSDIFSPAQMAAANAFIRHVSNPILLRDLSAAELKTDEGRKYLSLLDSYRARLDLAMRPSQQWLSNKVKDKGTIPIVQAMLDGGGAAATYLSTQLPLVAPDWKSAGISRQQLMTFEAARRYENADWLTEIASASDPLTLQREQIMMMALSIDLSTRQLRETQQTNIMLGAIYQASLNKDFMPEVLNQYRKATSSR
jgi:hypothetical protein